MSTQPHSERSHGSSSRGGQKLQHHEREDERRTARVHPSGARSDAYVVPRASADAVAASALLLLLSTAAASFCRMPRQGVSALAFSLLLPFCWL